MSKLPKGSTGNTPIGNPGTGAPGGIARSVSTKVWDGATSAHPMSQGHVVGYGITGVEVKPNHGGVQQAAENGVKYKGVSTEYC